MLSDVNKCYRMGSLVVYHLILWVIIILMMDWDCRILHQSQAWKWKNFLNQFKESHHLWTLFHYSRVVHVFAPIIAHIANLSLVQGKLPTRYKKAQVTSLLKKEGPRSWLTNKLSPDIQPQHHLKSSRTIVYGETQGSRKIIQKFQQISYRQHHSTETAMLKILDDVYAAAD